MARNVVILIFLMMLAGILILVSDIKNAYKVIPIKAEPTLETAAFADWREFTAQENAFTVQLPQPAQYASESAPIPDTGLQRAYEMYISQQLNGTIYMISMITYPAQIDTSNQNQMVEDFVQEIVRSRGDNRLQQSSKVSYQGREAVNFIIKNKDYDMKAMAFMIDKTVYLLSYVAQKNNFNEDEYNHFINSFRLK